MTAWDPDAWTRNMIQDLRANGGSPSSGPLVGRPLAIMTTRGAKSGRDRTAIVTYHRHGESYVIAATAGGADEHPAWYHNLVAHPEATFEAASDTFRVVAREATGDERQQLYDEHARLYPEFAAYPSKVSRVIPVFVLERRAG
ncbi:MAG TPA: nitroreductase/quinone reductase family protein [Candidatus Acidoferrum sp.]|nr:nitroreductase/quinone reductase family protein [Candidatus Acidoferrum sp.]